MRRWMKLGVRLLPMTGCLFIGACGVTSRQLTDFATTTAIQVVVQSVVSAIQAGIVDNAGST